MPMALRCVLPTIVLCEGTALTQVEELGRASPEGDAARVAIVLPADGEATAWPPGEKSPAALEQRRTNLTRSAVQ